MSAGTPVKPPIVDIWANGVSSSPDIAPPGFIDTGYTAPGGIPAIPNRGNFNWILNWIFNAIRYFCTFGIVDWDSGEAQYVTGSIVRGPTTKNYYVCTGTPTTGSSPETDTTNWQLWLASPIGSATWNQIIWAWKNHQQQSRAVVTNPGFIEGKVLKWQEGWRATGFRAGKSALGSGPFAGDWFYSIDGDGAGGEIIGGDATASAPTFGGPGSPTNIRTSNIYLATNPAGTTLSSELLESPAHIILDDDTSVAIQWEATVKLSTAGSPLDENTMGISVGSLQSTSGYFLASLLPGVGFIIGGAYSTWHVFYKGVGVGGYTVVDTAVSPGVVRDRFRIEYYGKNTSNDGTAKANFYINQAPVAISPIGVNLTGSAPVGPATARTFFRHADNGQLTWMNVQIVDFHANTWPGNVVY